MLTILLPNQSDNEVDLEGGVVKDRYYDYATDWCDYLFPAPTATYLVGDTASQFPTDLKYLHLGGLAASDNLFMVNPTGDQRIGQAPRSHLDSVVALRLDDCPRLTVNGLFGAMRHGHLRSLLRLHAYWLENEGAWCKLLVTYEWLPVSLSMSSIQAMSMSGSSSLLARISE